MEQRLTIMRKRHSPDEIQLKLRQAEKMVAEGRRQTDIAKVLDISVMTYHRWRKSPPALIHHVARGSSIGTANDEEKGILQLQVENTRLRRLVTDLLLEKVRLEESLHAQIKRRRRPK